MLLNPRPCPHRQTTLVQHHHVDFGWFACYQCDACGAITQQAVSADDLDRANDAPWLDAPMYLERTTERRAQDPIITALRFFGKAVQ